MADRKYLNCRWKFTFQLFLCSAMFLSASSEERGVVVPLFQGMHVDEKRYLGALAKNGRMPTKFMAASEKRQDNDDQSFNSNSENKLAFDFPNDVWTEEKKHFGAFLKTHGKPSFSRLHSNNDGEDGSRAIPKRLEEVVDANSESTMVGNTAKRNVATLAGLGRLNAVRFARFEPQYYGGMKRVIDEEMNDGSSNTDENAVDESLDECNDSEENEKGDNNENNYIDPRWVQTQKRYVAALARSGRLPIWHPQRMWWGGKRDTPYAYWMRYRSGARSNGMKRQNALSTATRESQGNNKRCKKSLTNANDKRNMAALARKGMVPSRDFVSV